MTDSVMLVFEGESTEFDIYKNLHVHYFTNKPILTSFNADIYQLWKVASQHNGNMDLFEIIKERSAKNQAELDGVSREDVSRIFLFFDYEGQATNASDADISAMLAHFDNETENGKLYISYPMVEAIRHFEKGVDFTEVIVPAKITGYASKTHPIGYKQLSACSPRFQNLQKLKKSDWHHIISENLRKANFVVNNTPKMPAYREIASLNQSDMFKQQRQKYILPKQLLAVLSAFPFFIIEYFGEKAYAELEPTTNPA